MPVPLVVDDVGDPSGRVVVYLHGAPDCRIARHPDDGLAAGLGIRLLAVDRPGYGGSPPLEPIDGSDVQAFGEALGATLDRLGVERCAVAAWSAGAPWGLGAAAALGPDRVDRVVTYAAIPPVEAYDDDAVAAASEDRAEAVAALAAGELTVAEVVDGWSMLLVPPAPVTLDIARAVVEEAASERSRAEVDRVPGMAEAMARSLAVAVEWHGDAGLRTDLEVQLTAGRWAPALAEVRVPVVLVHGAADPLSGPAVGEWLARHLPAAAAEVVAWPDAGHHALLPRWQEWLGYCAR